MYIYVHVDWIIKNIKKIRSSVANINYQFSLKFTTTEYIFCLVRIKFSSAKTACRRTTISQLFLPEKYLMK